MATPKPAHTLIPPRKAQEYGYLQGLHHLGSMENHKEFNTANVALQTSPPLPILVTYWPDIHHVSDTDDLPYSWVLDEGEKGWHLQEARDGSIAQFRVEEKITKDLVIKRFSPARISRLTDEAPVLRDFIHGLNMAVQDELANPGDHE